MMEQEKPFDYKNFFKNYGFFLAILAVLFLILFYSVYLARKPWKKYLKVQVEKVLNESDSGHWTVGNFIPIENPFTISAACYEAKNNDSNIFVKAIIIRIQTFYGPASAVFTVDENEIVHFAGYSSLHGRVNTQLTSGFADKRLDYWKRKIPEIIPGSGVKNEKQ